MKNISSRALRLVGLALAFTTVSPFSFSVALAQDNGALIRELKGRIDRAEQTRAADPKFLEDLRQILGRYETGWPISALSDSFTDNDYTRAPAWTVHRGAWMVDRQYGLKRTLDGTDSSTLGDASLTDRAISSGDGWSGPAANAFDDDVNTSWTSTQTGTAVVGQAYIGQNFGTGNAKAIRKIAIRQSLGYANSYASEIEVQRWTGSGWSGVGIAKLPAKDTRMVVDLGSPAASEQWRLIARKMVGTGAWQVAEVEMMAGSEGAGTPSQQAPQQTQQQGSTIPGQKIEDLAVQVLGEVIRNATGQPQRPDAPPAQQPAATQPPKNTGIVPPHLRNRLAEIATPAQIGNSFVVEVGLYTLAEGGQFSIGLYRTENRDSGYRLTLEPGTQSTLELAALSRGYRVIDSDRTVAGPSSTQMQTLRWERKADGTMTVSADGRVLFSVADQTFKDGFAGVVLISEGADVAVRSIKVGTVK